MEGGKLLRYASKIENMDATIDVVVKLLKTLKQEEMRKGKNEDL